MKLTKLFFSIILLLLSGYLSADDFPDISNPPRLVNDFVGIFNQSENNQLEQELVQFNRETSSQIAIVVVDNLHGYAPSDYTQRLAQKWKIGQKGKDNGILIMIKPIGNTGERKAFISVGYGLEGVIPDAIANRIVDIEMIPQFREGNYFQGVSAAVSRLKSLSLGEFSAADYEKNYNSRRQRSSGNKSGWLIIIAMAVLFLIKPGIMASKYSRANNLGFWAAMWLIMSSGRSNDNDWHHFHGGTGGFGGFGGGGFGGSGGGFGGFGGGSFGGGGAGGSW